MKCLTGNLPSQPECSSTGRKSVCLTEVAHPSLKKSAEMGETRNSSWCLSAPYRAVPKLHANGVPGLWHSESPNICRFTLQIFSCPSSHLSCCDHLSYLFYTAAELKLVYQEEEMALSQH